MKITDIEYRIGDVVANKIIKKYLITKWGKKCVYCKKTKPHLEIEHNVPKSRGGSDKIYNLVLSCIPCNRKKGNKTAAEFGHPEIKSGQRKWSPMPDRRIFKNPCIFNVKIEKKLADHFSRVAQSQGYPPNGFLTRLLLELKQTGKINFTPF